MYFKKYINTNVVVGTANKMTFEDNSKILMKMRKTREKWQMVCPVNSMLQMRQFIFSLSCLLSLLFVTYTMYLYHIERTNISNGFVQCNYL